MNLVEALLDSTPDAVMLVDAQGRLALVNRRTEELFGYVPGALFGIEVEQLIPERFRFDHLAHRDGYAARPRARRMVGRGVPLYGLREDGSEFPVEISLNPIAVESEDFVITIVRDVSERRTAALEHAQLGLERTAHADADAGRERLASILGEVDAIVWEADTRRRRFGYVSAHAAELLGYPLSAWLEQDDFWRRIVEPEDLPLAELLFQEAIGRESDHDHEYRVRAADERTLWVRDRVRVSRGEDGALRLHGVTVETTARRALEEDLLHAQKMDAVGQLAGGMAHDFGNLLLVVASKTDLLLERVRDESALAELRAISDAAGRAGALVAQLLAFGRAGAGHSELADLDVARVPRAPHDAAGGPREHAEDREAPVVLVVEDESAVRRLVRTVLEEAGYQVREVASGRDALAYLEQRSSEIDLILSDVVMADITGPELVAHLAPLSHSTRLMFMSDFADSQLLSRGLAEGSIGVLHKPFTPAELSHRVALMLSEERSGSPQA